MTTLRHITVDGVRVPWSRIEDEHEIVCDGCHQPDEYENLVHHVSMGPVGVNSALHASGLDIHPECLPLVIQHMTGNPAEEMIARWYAQRSTDHETWLKEHGLTAADDNGQWGTGNPA